MGRLFIVFVIISGLLFTPLKVFAAEVYIDNEATAIVNKDKKVESTTTIIESDDEQEIKVFNEAVATSDSDDDSEANVEEQGFKLELKGKSLVDNQDEAIQDIGQEIFEIVQEQNKLQKEISQQLQQIKSRSRILKRIIGPDYKMIARLEQQLEQIDFVIERLEKFEDEVLAQEEVKESIEILHQQRVNLENQIDQEKQTKSLFGWIFRIFSRS